ncbi:MAG: hypothetical protein OXC09_12280 [Truepera sp.]|nr:hypothetical protein [Truepera sp.]
MSAARLRTTIDRALEVLRRSDSAAATVRAERLRRANPEVSTEELAQRIIGRASRRSAAVGAAAASVALLPGAGTLAALTLGLAADLTATARIQAEMVLELAALHQLRLSTEGRRRPLLAVASVGGSALAGRALTTRLGDRIAQRGLTRALPLVGVAAASGGNALTTYLLGRRTARLLRHHTEAAALPADRPS